MSKKIPCGGFYLDDMLSVDENGKLGVNDGEPFKQLVTDGEGNAKWEDRLAYVNRKISTPGLGGRGMFVRVADIPQDLNLVNGLYVAYWYKTPNVEHPDKKSTSGFFVNEKIFFADQFIAIATEDNVKFIEGEDVILSLPKKGVYFFYDDPTVYVAGVAFSKDAATPEIEWDGQLEEVKQVDEKFLPDVTKLVMLSSTSGSAKKFEITVDDTGTLSATEITSGDATQ